jgi:hypothetical protein
MHIWVYNKFAVQYFLNYMSFGIFLYLYKPRYNWNIVESGVKHHKPHPILLLVPPAVFQKKFCFFSNHTIFPKTCQKKFKMKEWVMSTDDKKSHDLLPENRTSCTEKNVWLQKHRIIKKKRTSFAC